MSELRATVTVNSDDYLGVSAGIRDSDYYPEYVGIGYVTIEGTRQSLEKVLETALDKLRSFDNRTRQTEPSVPVSKLQSLRRHFLYKSEQARKIAARIERRADYDPTGPIQYELGLSAAYASAEAFISELLTEVDEL